MDISKLTVSYLDGFVGIPKPEGFVQKDKVLPYMTVVYPKTGYYDLRVEDGPFQRLEQGQGVYITKPFQRHTIIHHTRDGAQTMQPLWLRLSVSYARQDATGWFEPPLFVTGAQAQGFREIIDALCADPCNHASYAKLYTGGDSPKQTFRKLELSGKLLRLLLEVSELKLPRESKRIAPALEMMQTAYSRELKVGQLARSCGMSEPTFYRVFREQTGKTPLRYLLDCRLEQAARLLAEKELTLSRIAQSCGFCDEFHLSRSFKKQYGISPREYRSSVSDL